MSIGESFRLCESHSQTSRQRFAADILDNRARRVPDTVARSFHGKPLDRFSENIWSDGIAVISGPYIRFQLFIDASVSASGLSEFGRELIVGTAGFQEEVSESIIEHQYGGAAAGPVAGDPQGRLKLSQAERVLFHEAAGQIGGGHEHKYRRKRISKQFWIESNTERQYVPNHATDTQCTAPAGRMNRIILLENDRIDGNRFRLSDHRASHILGVLKAHSGDRVRVGLLNGPVGTADISSVDHSCVELVCEFSDGVPRMHPTVDILCAIPRPKSLKKVLFTVAMMGVRRIMFIRANRTDKSYLQTPLLSAAGWTPHLLDGLAQGGLTRLPRVSVHPLFRPFVEDELPQLVAQSRPDILLLPDPHASLSVRDTCEACDRNHILVVIGPEGGWVPFELDLLETQGFVRCRLGPWTLRVEAAIVAVLAQIWLACDG